MTLNTSRSIWWWTLWIALIAGSGSLISCRLPAEISGRVQSGDQTLANASLALYRAGTDKGAPQVLGKALSDAHGAFTINFLAPLDPRAVLYLIADIPQRAARFRHWPGQRPVVRFATVLTLADAPTEVVLNERTTVATAYTMAQFIDDAKIRGEGPGPWNSAGILGNLVDIQTGEVSGFLTSDPETNPNVGTSTTPTLNSLANLLAACVNETAQCRPLFDLTTPPGGRTPRDTLQAAVNIVHYPSSNAGELYLLSRSQSIYQPALDSNDSAQIPTAWLLALLYNGNDMEFDGPGNIAFDAHGNAWVNNNYEFNANNADPDAMVCGSTEVFKLTPTGEINDFGGVDGSDQPGIGAGGLYGAGFGITLDTEGLVWVSNFGFQGTKCENDPTQLFVSVSQFSADGIAQSPDGDPLNDTPGGYRDQENMVQAPQGIKSDYQGNIWVANCATDSVTRFQQQDPDIPGTPPSQSFSDIGLDNPFDIAFDTDGHAWVTSNGSNSVVALDTDGSFLATVSSDTDTDDGINRPMGIASDSFGNLWVANAGVMNPPCPALLAEEVAFRKDTVALIGEDGGVNINASVTLIDQRNRSNGEAPEVTTFGRGDDGIRDGLRWPWGIAVDGNDNVWVANFAGQRVMQLCGVRGACPPGVATGDPISPDSGYQFDGLTRNTGIQIDPSGNVWLANNWILDAFSHLTNPGGHEVAVLIGLAKPVRTPLIGTPRTYD